MEGNDFLSATGSGGNGPSAPAMQSSAALGMGANMMSGAILSSGMRPTTAAAVANSGGGGAGMESDQLLGNAAPDDLDVDYEMRQAGNERPNTAGALYNRGAGATAGAQNQGASWGYSRQPVGDYSSGTCTFMQATFLSLF